MSRMSLDLEPESHKNSEMKYKFQGFVEKNQMSHLLESLQHKQQQYVRLIVFLTIRKCGQVIDSVVYVCVSLRVCSNRNFSTA